MDSFKEFSKLIPFSESNSESIKSDKIKISIVKKYLFISAKSKLILVKISLFIKIFFGLLNDKIWFREYLNNEYTLINLSPELVEKKDPPIITKIKNIRSRLDCEESNEKPILDILLESDNKLFEKSLLKLKKRKNIEIITTKYIIKCKSS